MRPNRIRADYVVLDQIAQTFSQQAAQVQNLHHALKTQQAQLAAGDWLGLGASAFYSEMTTEVLPALQRLQQALAQAGQTTGDINRVMQEAEAAAARLWRLTGTPALGSAEGDHSATMPAGAPASAPPAQMRAPDPNGGPNQHGGEGEYPNAQLPELTDDPVENVQILTEALNSYGVTITMNGEFTPEEQQEMLTNILTGVSSYGNQALNEIQNMGLANAPQDPGAAFEAVFGPTHITIQESGGLLPGTSYYGYNNGVADGAFQITLSSHALLNETNSNVFEGEKITPVELVAHEIGHNFSSLYLMNNEAATGYHLFVPDRTPEGWDIHMHARSSTKAGEVTSDYVAHWGLYGSETTTPWPLTTFMQEVIKSELSDTPTSVQYRYDPTKDRMHVYYHQDIIIEAPTETLPQTPPQTQTPPGRVPLEPN